MDITDFAEGRPWAITANAFDMLARRMESFRADRQEIQAALSLLSADAPAEGYQMVGGVAVIPIAGMISDETSLFTLLFGGTSIAEITELFDAALLAPAVRAIVFKIKSPGGTIDGVDALSARIHAARGTKPIVAYAAGTMASAAYWIGSAADLIVADRTAILGSIGTLAEHRERSRADEMGGIKRTYIAGGKYKTLGNDAEPLGPEARTVIQGMLDQLYSVFVDTVARNRGESVEKVLAEMADGREFIGTQAVEAGLADVVGTIETAIELALIMVDDNRTD